MAPEPTQHVHARTRLAPMPIPQPTGGAGWHCGCGAVLFPTYPIGPAGIDASRGPSGSAWIEATDIAAALNCDAGRDPGAV